MNRNNDNVKLNKEKKNFKKENDDKITTLFNRRLFIENFLSRGYNIHNKEI
jgi:hypothetical protein